MRLQCSPHWLVDRDHLFAGSRIQRRVKDGRAPIRAAMPERVKCQLVEHLARKRLFPQISILGIEHRRDAPAADHHEVRPRCRGSPSAGILGGIAARMEQLARPGSTLITAETRRLADPTLHLLPIGQLDVKGLPEGIEAFELLGPAGPGTRSPR